MINKFLVYARYSAASLGQLINGILMLASSSYESESTKKSQEYNISIFEQWKWNELPSKPISNCVYTIQPNLYNIFSKHFNRQFTNEFVLKVSFYNWQYAKSTF